MALLSQDEWMTRALQPDQGDFFDNHMMPASFPEIERAYGTVDKYKAENPVGHKEDRTKCKAVVYGLSFDRGAAAIAASLKMPTKDAEKIINNFLSAASNFAQWREDVREAAVNPAKRDMLVNPFGRRFQSEVITSRNYKKVQREALAFLPQSTASDICLSTGIRINKQLQRAGYHIFNIVHDALMIEGPEDGAEDVGKLVAAEMQETGRMVFGDTIPFLADYSIGPSWADLS